MDYKVIDHVKKSIYVNLEEIANAPIAWDKLKNKTLLLTGAGGFIGYYMTCGLLLRNDLYSDNCKITALVRDREKAEKRGLELCISGNLAGLDIETADLVTILSNLLDNAIEAVSRLYGKNLPEEDKKIVLEFKKSGSRF